MAKRPNFLLFITDQHRADFLGCYGHPVLRTPHIDSIAARGTAFDKFYVASPVCMPNRSSLMTVPHAVGARRAMQRHSAVDECGDLRRSAARRRLPHRADRQEPSAELHVVAADHQAAAAARGLPRAAAGAGAGAAQRSRRQDVRAGDAGILERQGGARRHAVLRLRSRHAGARARRRAGRRLRPLAGGARSQGEEPARAEEQRCRTTTRCRRPIARAIPEELYATSFLGERARGLSRRRRSGRAVLPDGVVSRSAPSVQSAGQILGHVQARAVPGAGSVLAQRLDAARAGAGDHRRARKPARPISPA